MATRMQQRRGTATQWTTADPILAPGEIGFESDTNQFKIGDGINHWSDLSYFKNLEDLGGSLDDYVLLSTKGQPNGVASLNADGVIPSEQIPSLVGLDTEIATAVSNAVNALVDGAPTALDTLNELAASLGDDPNLAQTLMNNQTNITDDLTGHQNALNAHGTASAVVGISDTQELTNKTISGTSNTITSIAQSSITLLETDLATINTSISGIETDITGINGDIATLQDDVLTAQENIGNAQADITSLNSGILLKADVESPTFTGTVSGITKSMVGLGNVDNTADADKPVSTATQTALNAKAPVDSPTFTGVVVLPADTTIGTVSTTEIGYLDGVTSSIQTQLDGKLATANLTEAAQDAVNTALTAGTGITKSYDDEANTLTLAVDTTAIQARVANVSDTEIGYLNGVASSIQDQLDAKLSSANAATTYQPLVPGVSDTEISYLDGVTSAIQTQLDSKVATADLAELAQDAIGNSLGSGLSYNDTTGAISVDTATIQARVSGVSDTEIGYLDGVTSAVQTQIDAKAPLASPTFTGTVAGITKTMVGLGNVDNTSDANKPVSTATQTALDLKAPKASPTFTGTLSAATVNISGDLTVSGTTTTVNATDLVVSDPMIYLGEGNVGNVADLGFVANFNDGTYQHSGLVRDASDSKWKLFKGVTDEPTTTVNFTQGSLDALAVGTFEATSATIGNVSNTELQYLDGVTSAIQTQLNAKTPELYTFVTDSTTARTLSLTDKFASLKFTNSGAVTITVPTNASVALPIGSYVEFYQWGAGQLTVAAATPATTSIRSTDSQTKSRTQYSSMVLIKVDTDEWYLTGDLTA